MIENFVQTPPEIQSLIAVGVTALFSFLVLWLGNTNIPVFKQLAEYLGQYKVQIVTWAVGLIVTFLDARLLSIPATWDNVLTIAFQLIVAVFAVLYGFALLAKRGVRSLR